jgi:hypothetical protein
MPEEKPMQWSEREELRDVFAAYATQVRAGVRVSWGSGFQALQP